MGILVQRKRETNKEFKERVENSKKFTEDSKDLGKPIINIDTQALQSLLSILTIGQKTW